MSKSLTLPQRQDPTQRILNKRWHEIQRLVPLTVESLGGNAKEVFQAFAMNDWPERHRRSPVDAFRFLEYLSSHEINQPSKLEWKRMKRLGNY